MIIANTQKELASSVVVSSTGAPVYSGTVYALIWLEDVADGYDGKFWDGSAWTVGVQTFPTATHIKGGVWSYTLSAAATTGEVGSIIHWTMADSDSEADITTTASSGEHRVMVYDGYGLTSLQISTIVDSVWDEQTSDHAAGGSMGATQAASAAPTVAAIADAVWDEAKSEHTTSTTFGDLATTELNIRGVESDTLDTISDQIDQIALPSDLNFRVWETNVAITVNIFVLDPESGDGYTGQTSYITLKIRRTVDDYYWSGSNWVTAVSTLTVTELDSTNSPGHYVYILPKTANTQARTYIAHANIDNPPTVTGDSYEIHISQAPYATAADLRLYESEPVS